MPSDQSDIPRRGRSGWRRGERLTVRERAKGETLAGRLRRQLVAVLDVLDQEEEADSPIYLRRDYWGSSRGLDVHVTIHINRERPDVGS